MPYWQHTKFKVGDLATPQWPVFPTALLAQQCDYSFPSAEVLFQEYVGPTYDTCLSLTYHVKLLTNNLGIRCSVSSSNTRRSKNRLVHRKLSKNDARDRTFPVRNRHHYLAMLLQTVRTHSPIQPPAKPHNTSNYNMETRDRIMIHDSATYKRDTIILHVKSYYHHHHHHQRFCMSARVVLDHHRYRYMLLPPPDPNHRSALTA